METARYAFVHAGSQALESTASRHADIAEIMTSVNDLERRCSAASAREASFLVEDLRALVHSLLRLEERLWPASADAPWLRWRWLAQAAAWLGALEMAHEYASAHAQTGDNEEALSAIWSGTMYAGESALAYARLQAELDGTAA